MFVSRLFNQVILQDRAALAASGSSTKTSGLQRLLLIGSSLGLFFSAIGFTVSFFKNRAMVSNAIAAAQAIPAGGSRGHLACISQFFAEVLKLCGRRWRGDNVSRRRRPFSMGWPFTPVTMRIRMCARPTTTASVSCCLTQAQGALRSHLQRLPAAPHRRMIMACPYEVLKGYLITTVQNDKVSDASPAPVLLKPLGRESERRFAEHATGAEAVRVLRERSEERQPVLVLGRC